jgi:pimeloyl-ACP methyl ester carboxylesterase
MTTYTSHTVDLAGQSIHYLQWGEPSATPVLCLHGYLDLSICWAALGQAFADSYCVVAPDFRGHGDSGWAAGGYGYFMPHYISDWIALLDHLQWDRCHIIGHSMGANCASLLAGSFPERVDKLIMLEGFGVPTWTPEATPGRLRAHVQRRQPSTSKPNRSFATLDEVARRILQSHPRYTDEHALFLAKHATKATVDGTYTWKFDPNVRIPNPAMYLLSQFHACWHEITAPTLQIIGNDSPFAAFSSADHWTIPDNTVIGLPNAMHMIQHETPDLLHNVSRAFLESHLEPLQPYLLYQDA